MSQLAATRATPSESNKVARQPSQARRQIKKYTIAFVNVYTYRAQHKDFHFPYKILDSFVKIFQYFPNTQESLEKRSGFVNSDDPTMSLVAVLVKALYFYVS